MTTCIPDRVLVGLEKRLRFARSAMNRQSGNETPEGLSLKFLSHQSDDHVKNTPDLELLRICLQYRALGDQARLLKALGTTDVAELSRLLTMGAVFSLKRIHLTGLADTDYSIAHFEEALFASNSSTPLKRKISRQVRSFLRELGTPTVRSCGTLVRFLGIFGCLTDRISTLDGLLNAFHSLKQTAWPIFGPELLSILQALCDSNFELTLHQVSYGYQLTSLWGLREIYIKLVALRALGGFSAEQAFLEGHDRIEADLLARFAISLVRREAKDPEYVRVAAGLDPINHLLSLCVNIHIATTRRELVVLKRQIVRLYQADPRAFSFLNWQSIHDAFELAAVDADQYSIFMKYLMSTPAVIRRFMTVAFARGRGQLTADISSFVMRLRGGNIDPIAEHREGMHLVRSKRRASNEFVRRFRVLPSAARQRVMQEILDKGMMERLAFAFPSSIIIAADSLPRVDNQSSILRMELANIAKRESVLTTEQADRIIEDEAHFLRMHLFHNLFKAGRIKIDWDYLTYTIARTIETQFEFVLSDRDETTVTSGVVTTVVRLFAQEVTDQLLFDSESSFEQSLGNNLRHGVIVPRFLRAFNEAVIASTDLNQSQIGDLNAVVLRYFGENASRILNLRDFVTATLNEYKDFWLIVDKNGDFYDKVRRNISNALVSKIEKRKDVDSWEAAEHIVDVFRADVELILAQAHDELSNRVKQTVCLEISNARRDCRQADISRTPVFFDLLDENILASFDEVGSWLGLLKLGNDVPDFHLLDLINFEAVSLIFSDLKKLRVTYSSYARTGPAIRKLNTHPKIRGEYFEAVQEIVHNLISNAYRYSGLGMNTEIFFDLITDEHDLIFRCVNTFSDKNYAQILEEYPKTIASLKSEIRLDSRTDTKSGFFKVRSVCARVFNSNVEINIPPLSQRSRRYTIEIRVPNVAKDALTQ